MATTEHIEGCDHFGIRSVRAATRSVVGHSDPIGPWPGSRMITKWDELQYTPQTCTVFLLRIQLGPKCYNTLPMTEFDVVSSLRHCRGRHSG